MGVTLSETHDEQRRSTGDARPDERHLQLRRAARWTQLGGLAVVVVLIGAIIGFQIRERNVVRDGVRAFGVDLSGMTRAEARQALTTAAQQRQGQRLTLDAGASDWTLTADDLGLSLDIDGAVDDALREGHHGWGPSRLALLWRLSAGDREVALDRVGVQSDALDSQLQKLAGAINTPRVDPSLTVDGDNLATYTHAQTGREFDVAASRDAILAGLATGKASVALTVDEDPPAATDADYAAARQQLATALDAPIEVDANGQTWTFTPDLLATRLSIDPPQGDQPAMARVDADWVGEAVYEIQVAIDRLPQSPRVWWDAGGQLAKTQDGAPGAQLDVDKTRALLLTAFSGGSADNIVQLPVTILPPPMLPADLNTLGITTTIAESSTPYAGSVPERAHNIELAAQRLNGTLIQPGQTFSFNAEVGHTSLDAGFQVAYGIADQNGELETVPSEAGGICQVATTVFQPVFWSGYEIDQRTTHSYWIESYVSNGYVGLDATVDEASGLDFKWTNNSQTAVLIETVADGKNFTVRLYGTPPGWRVEVDPPEITNRVEADETTDYQASDTIPDGSMRRIEHAEDGFDAHIVRRVYVGDQTRELEYDEHYGVARNVVLVGSSTGELPDDFTPPD